MKKVLSLFVAVVMIISAMSCVSSFAATQEIYKLDLTTHSGLVVEEDGKTAAVIGKSGDKYTVGEDEYALSNAITVKNDNGILPAGTQGIVINTTFKLESTAPQIILLPGTNVYPRYIDLSGSTIKYNGNGSVGQINTSQSIAANVWYDLTFMLNYKTGYLKVISTNLSTGDVRTHVKTDADFILSDEQIASIKQIRWWHTGNKSGKMYISKYEIYAEDDIEAIAPSKTIIRDDFDDDTATVNAPWTSTSITVEATDRGNSAAFGSSDGTSLTYSQSGSIISSMAKGLVIEFAAKLGYTSTKPNFVVSAKDLWYNGGSKLIQFHNNAQGVTRDGQSGDKILSSWAKDKWYDIRLEIGFKEEGKAIYRYLINDGASENIYVFDNVSTNLFDDLSTFKKIEFTYASGDGKAYIDDVNIFWLDEASAKGITAGKDTVSVNNRFEGLAEGTDALANDMSCGAPNSFISSGANMSAVDYSIATVADSGRGKSFKAVSNLELGQYADFYKDFSAIQGGVVEFDIMFGSSKGLTLISAQTSNAINGQMSKNTIFRFDNWGNIKDASNKVIHGTYESNTWYKVVLSAVVNDGMSGVKYQVYSPNGLVAESTLNTGTAEICRDSIRYAMITMHDYKNTIYVDNYRAYKPSDVAYGIYPVGESTVKGSTLTPENKIKLSFSKFVDLSKSKFTVNGEAVTATGTDMITLGKALEAGEVYDVEYSVYDINGYRTMGYVNNIAVEGVYNISDYSEATLDNPAASATVRIGNGASKKDVILLVGAYNGDKLVNANICKKTVGVTEEEFTVAVDANGADSVKTFLWNAENLVPLK